MERYVILITDSLQDQTEFLRHLIEEVGKDFIPNDYIEPVTFVRVIVPEPSQQEVHSTWLSTRSLSLSDINVSSPDNTLQQGETNSDLSLSTKLHDVADTLPAQGCCVSVLVSLSINWMQNVEPDVHVSLYAALKRLKIWHNSVIRFIIHEVDQESSPLLPFTKYLHAELLESVKEFKLISQSVLWLGQLVVLDSRRSVLQCFKNMVFDMKTTLEGCEVGQSPVKWVKTEPDMPGLQYLNSRNLAGLSLNCTCEIVEEVDLVTLPSFILSPCRLEVRPLNLHSESEFMKHVQNNPEVGYVLRVGYCRRDDMKICGEGLRSTKNWKETISANINSINDMFGGGHDCNGYLHLLVTCDRLSEDLSCNKQNLSCAAYILRSPQEINGGTLEFIQKHSLIEQSLMSNENEEEFKSVINNIPLCDWSDIEKTQVLIVHIQREVLQTWVERRLNREEPVLMNETELSTLLQTVHREVLTAVQRSEQTVNMVNPRYKLSAQKDLTKTEDWPEKEMLRALESKSRKLSRFVSSESLLQSSPIQPSEGGEKSVDVCDFLKLFKADGSASQDAQHVSVLQGKEHSVLYKKMSSFDERETKWPESKEVRYHDIYYNIGRKCERFDEECSKLRQRYVTCETRSTVSSSSSGVLDHAWSTLKTRANKKLKCSPVRRSPRKHAPANRILSRMPSGGQRKRSCPDDELECKQRNRAEPFTEVTMQTKVKSPATRKTTHRVAAGPAKEDVPPRRISRVDMHEEKGGKLSRSDSTSDQAKKKSRSDRHKRRLQQIVQTVLKGKGVRPDNPLYGPCSSKLFMVTKIYAMELPTSRNLVVEMTKIAEGQVQQVMDLELMKRESST